MRLRWNARADSVSTVIMWIGSFIAAAVCVAWLMNNLTPDHIILQEIDNELILLHRELNKGCNMYTFNRTYNPDMKYGNLIIHGDQVCIDSSKCRVLLYETNGTEAIFDNGNILLLDAYRCTSLNSCDSIYYSSDNVPEYKTTNILIRDASLCDTKHAPIRRCRMLACYLDTYANVLFDGLYYVNLRKYKNGTFKITPNYG